MRFVLSGMEVRTTAPTKATEDADVDAAKKAPPATPPLRPASWRPLDDFTGLYPLLPPLLRILRDVALSSLSLSTSSSANGNAVVVVLGAGCFWHVEAALCHIPGVIDTKARYTGGMIGIGDDNYNDVGAIIKTTKARTTWMSPPHISRPVRRCVGVRPDTPRYCRCELTSTV